jgi:uncharacterized membrane protein
MDPDPTHDDLRRQLEDLTDRLARVERRLGINTFPSRAVPLTQPPQTAPSLPPRATPAPHGPVEHAPAWQEADAPPSRKLDLLHAVVEPEPELIEVPANAPNPARSLEGLVGGRYFLAAGSIVVVIGVGLFLKLGYDAGWFRMSAAWKCIWGAVFGLAMIAAGEVARRKINVLASSGLSAAGLGALYLSSYAAHGFYSLIGPTPAFIFLALVTAIGIAIAIVARQAGVAVLAMLGGYLAPFLLHVEHPSVVVVPLHTLALLAVGLVLSGWKPEVFRVLRSIAWWGTVVLGTLWLAAQGAEHPLVALPYFALFWAAVHAELITSVRAGLNPVDPPVERPRLLVRWNNARPIATSLSTSLWCVFFGVVTLRVTPVLPDWFIPAGATAAAALLAMTLAGHLRVLKDSPRTDAQRLGAGLAMQAGALLITAVALAFTGSMEVVAWLALGVAAVGAASWIGAPSLAVYGIISLCIAVARLITYDAFIARRTFTPSEVLFLVVDRWTLLMLLASAAWTAGALLILRLRTVFQPDPENPRPVRERFLDGAPDVSTFVGVALLLGAFLHPDTSPGAVSLAYLVIGVLVSAARLAEPRLRLPFLSLMVLVAATSAWIRAYLTPSWAESAPDAGLFHPGAGVGLLITLATAALAYWYHRDTGRETGSQADHPLRPYAVICTVFGATMLWAVTSLEIYRLADRYIEPGTRAPLGGLSIWWGLFALGVLAVGFQRRLQSVRIVGLLLAALAILTWSGAFVMHGWTDTARGWAIHPGFFICMFLAAVLAGVARRWRTELSAAPDDNTRSARHEVLSLIITAVALTWVATSLESFRLAGHFRAGDEAQHGALSVWWGLYAVALLAAGFRWKAAPARYAGLALLGVATLKALIIDLADVSAGWRVVSVLGLGLLMLGVALVYVRASARLLAPVNVPPTAAPPAPDLPRPPEAVGALDSPHT